MKIFKYEDINNGRGQIYIIMAINKDEANKKLKDKLKNNHIFKLVNEIEGDIFESDEIFFD